MFAWNGQTQAAFYAPSQDVWVPVSPDTGVESRYSSGTFGSQATASLVWTGSEIIVWGGSFGVRPTRYLRNGSRYDPATDTWAPIPDGPGASPAAQAVWTGNAMLVWPGGDGIGGAYRPYWLVVRDPAQAYGINDEPMFVAQPGEVYRVIQLERGWALVQADGDPPSLQQWLAVDDRVELSTPYSPGEPAPPH